MEKKTNKNVTQMNLYIRILAGGYLVYLAYDIFRMRNPQASNFWLMMLFVAVFVIVGAGFVLVSIKSLIKKEYYDPNQDDSEEESAAEVSAVEIQEESATAEISADKTQEEAAAESEAADTDNKQE